MRALLIATALLAALACGIKGPPRPPLNPPPPTDAESAERTPTGSPAATPPARAPDAGS